MHSVHEELFSARGLTYARGDRNIIQNFDFRLSPGDRFGLVGFNGSGKTTLLRLLAGQLTGDAGSIRRAPGLRTGYLAQLPLRTKAGSGGEEQLGRLRRLLGDQPHLLLLDEPENDLDSVARLRIRRWLMEFSGALVIASHRPSFLAGITDRLLILEDDEASGSRPRSFNGDYATFERERARLNQERERSIVAAEAERARLIAGRSNLNRTRSERSRVPRDNDKLTRRFRLDRATRSRRQLALLQKRIDAVEIPDHPGSGTQVRFEAKRTGERELVMLDFPGGEVAGAFGFSLSLPPLVLRNRDRILLTGRNGSGKTALINWIAGQLERSGAIRTRWLPQESNWPFHRTVRDWLEERLAPDENPVYRMIRSGLPASARDRSLSKLSAGERLRLWFATIGDSDFLILDEPTNHMDYESRRALFELLAGFAGGWLLVSHDEDWRTDLKINEYFEMEKGRLTIR